MMELKGISKKFGDLVLFDAMDFTVGASEVTCLLGPSGCGKTTLLNMMAGLILPDFGETTLPGRVSFVFQEPRLLPWETVRDNAAYAMDLHMPRSERDDAVDGMLREMEILDAADKFPSEISGGMARRCSLARALLAPSEALLMDEPLTSLDPQLRDRVLEKLPALLANRTVVLVTHDYVTAHALSSRICLMSAPPVRISPVETTDLEGIIRQIAAMDSSE